MFFFGYRSGRELANEPERVALYAFSRVNAQKLSGRSYLVYPKADGTPLYLFDLDSNHLLPYDYSNARLEIAPKSSGSYGVLLDDPSFITGIGGITFGITVKDLLTKPELLMNVFSKVNTERKKQLWGMVIGSVIGYSAGYSFAVRGAFPGPESPAVISVVKDESRWITEKRNFYVMNWFRCLDLVGYIEDPTIKERLLSTLFKARQEQLAAEKKGVSVQSKDLDSVVHVYNLIYPIVKQKTEQVSWIEDITAWWSWVVFWLVIMACITFIGLGITERTQDRNTMRPRRFTLDA